MAVTNYMTFNGMIVHENRGGTQRDYVSDTLGSAAALVDSTQAVTDSWDYWPYGEIFRRTGTSTTPFTFVGLLGYFKDVVDKHLYVRLRHLRIDVARWSTADPLWPLRPIYQYGSLSPVDRVDRFGLDACYPWGCQQFQGNRQAMCDYAKKLKMDFTEGYIFPDGGGTVCCDGIQYACVWNPGVGAAGIAKCLLQHEEEHLKQVQCPPEGFSRSKFPDKETQKQGECAAYGKELACLLQNWSEECRGMSELTAALCHISYEGRIKSICDFLRGTLKCSPLPPPCAFF